MADIYKTAVQAGREARSRGQTGISVEDGSLRAMAESARSGMSTVPSYAPNVAPKRSAITPPAQAQTQDDAIAAILSRNTAAGYENLIPQEAPTQQQGGGSLLGDAGRAVMGGLVNLGGGVYELGNIVSGGRLDSATKDAFGTSGTEVIGSARDYWRSGESPELKAQREKLEKADGFFDSFKTIVTNPRLAGAMTLEMLPQLVTVAGAARMVAAKTLAGAAEAGLSAEAAQAAAATNATRTVLGLNAAMEGGAAGQDARQTVMTMSEAELDQSPQYQALVKQYGDTPDGRTEARLRLANDASMFAAAIAAPISLISGKVTGAGELESKVATRGVTGLATEGAEQTGKRTALGVAKDVVVAGAKEVPQEAIEEGGSQFGTNVGVKYSGAKPDQDLTEGVGQAAGAGGALGLVAGVGFGSVGKARTALSGNTETKTDTPPAGTKSDIRTAMSDAEYGAAVNSAPLMAAAYARADEATRARLRAANPNLNFDELTQDEKTMKVGSSLIDNNPSFFEAFNARLPQVSEEKAPASEAATSEPPFDPDTPSDVPGDRMPLRERMRVASELAQEGVDQAEGRYSREKPAAAPAPESLNAGPEIQIPGLPSQDVLLRGYQRRAENLMSMPEGARAAAATSSMQEMISRGFTPEQAQSVFGRVTNPQAEPAQVEEIEAAAPPEETSLDFTQNAGEDIRPKIDPNFQTFAQVRERMAQKDLGREPTAKVTDYIETPVPPQIRDLAKRFGVQVYGFRYAGKNKVLRGRQGASLSGGVILLNADAQNAHLSIFGHELYHELRRRNPEAAAQLEQEILSYVTQPGKEKLADKLLKVGYDISKIDEEMTADLMGVMFSEREFWAELGQKQPTLLQKIIQVIDDMLAKFGDLSSRKGEVAKYITDMQAVREMLVGFVNESQGGTEQSQKAPTSLDEESMRGAEKYLIDSATTSYVATQVFPKVREAVASGQFTNEGLAQFNDAIRDYAYQQKRYADEVARLIADGMSETDAEFQAFENRGDDWITHSEVVDAADHINSKIKLVRKVPDNGPDFIRQFGQYVNKPLANLPKSLFEPIEVRRGYVPDLCLQTSAVMGQRLTEAGIANWRLTMGAQPVVDENNNRIEQTIDHYAAAFIADGRVYIIDQPQVEFMYRKEQGDVYLIARGDYNPRLIDVTEKVTSGEYWTTGNVSFTGASRIMGPSIREVYEAIHTGSAKQSAKPTVEFKRQDMGERGYGIDLSLNYGDYKVYNDGGAIIYEMTPPKELNPGYKLRSLSLKPDGVALRVQKDSGNAFKVDIFNGGVDLESSDGGRFVRWQVGENDAVARRVLGSVVDILTKASEDSQSFADTTDQIASSLFEKLGLQEPSLFNEAMSYLRSDLDTSGDEARITSELQRFVDSGGQKTDLDFTSGSIEENIDLTPEQQAKLDKVREILRTGKETDAAKAFRESNLFREAGIKFTDLKKENAAKVSEESQQPPQESPVKNKSEYAKLFRDLAQSVSQESPRIIQQRLDQYAEDMRGLGFNEDEIEATLRGVREEVDPKELTGKKIAYGYTRPAELKGTKETDVLGESGNPDAFVGTVEPEPVKIEKSMREQIAMREEEAARKAKRKEQSKESGALDSIARAKYANALRKKNDRRKFNLYTVRTISIDGKEVGRIYEIEPGRASPSERFALAMLGNNDSTIFRFAYSVDQLTNSLPKNAEVAETAVKADRQGDLNLSRDKNEFDARVERVMLGVDDSGDGTAAIDDLERELAYAWQVDPEGAEKALTQLKIEDEYRRLEQKEKELAEERIKREREFKKREAERLQAQREGRAPQEMTEKDQFADDKGGVMTNLAQSGAMGQEASKAADLKKKSDKAKRYINDKEIEEAQRRMNKRVQNLLESTDDRLREIQKIRADMEKAGIPDSEIQQTIGSAERTLLALRDGVSSIRTSGDLSQIVVIDDELKRLAESQNQEIAGTTVGGGFISDQNEPQEFTGSDAVQAELPLNDAKMTDARKLVADIISKKINFDDAVAAVRENEIGMMYLYDAMRDMGLSVNKDHIDLSGNIAANHTLKSYISTASNPFTAREQWLRAYDAIPLKMIVPISKEEQTAYNDWTKKRRDIRNRLNPQTESASIEKVFPNALFLNYTLSEMRSPSDIKEADLRSMIIETFDDPARAWLADLKEVLRIRPDFRPQLDNFLTKSEMEAFNEFSERENREAKRNLDMKMRSPAYSQIDSLRYLSPELYVKYRQKIAEAEMSQLSVILHSAQEANDKAKAEIEAGRDPATALAQYFDEEELLDELRAKSPDEMENEDDDNGPLDGSLRFRRGRFSGAVAAQAVQEHLTLIFSKWDTPPAYTVVQNPNQLPRRISQRLTSRFATNEFRGAIDPQTGHIYIFSDFVTSVEDAEFTMFHELYGHWGARAFLGDSMDSFLNTQYRLNKRIQEEADRQMEQAKQDGMPMTKLESIEEAIADEATKGNDGPFRQLIGRLVRWLRKHGMNNVADWMDSNGNAELAFVLAQARKVAMSKQGISPLAGAPTQAMYSRKKMPVEMFAIRDGKTTAYARINPVTQQWTVFTMKDPNAPLSQVNFSAESVDEAWEAHDRMKKFGTVTLSRDRDTRQEVDPNNASQIPDFKDLTGWAKFKRNMTIQFQNMFLPIFEVARFLESKGVKNSVIDDLIKYESRLQYYVDDYTRRYATPIQQLLKAIGEKGATMEDVDLFLMARHAEERNNVIKAINPKNTKGSGLSTKDAQKILKSNNDGKWTGYAKELEQLGNLMDQMGKDKLGYMLNTGLINKFQYESLMRYKHYVNLSGNKELGLDEYDGSELGGRAFNVAGNDIKRATGRGTMAVDVLQNTMNSYLSTLIRGQKNRPLQAMLNMFEQNPDATYVQVEKINTKKQINVERFNFDKKILKAIGTDKATEADGKNFLKGLYQRMERGELDSDGAMAELAQRIRLAEERRDIEPEEAARAIRNISEQVVMSARLSPDGYVSTVETQASNKNSVVVKINGAPVTMSFTGRGIEFFQSITGMNVQQSSGFVEAIGAWNRLFSQMVTTWNPAWVPVNALRDIQTAFANAAADPEVGAELAGKMLKDWKRMHKVAFRHLVADQANAKQGFWGEFLKSRVAKNPLTDEEKQLIDEFFKEGGGTFFLDRAGLEQTLDKLNRTLNPAKISGGVKEAAQWTEDRLSGVADLMELFTMPVEMAPRLAAYKVIRDNHIANGMDPAEARSKAARYAKELTVNFNMKGANKQFRALYVFANPAIQGSVRMFQDLKEGNYKRFGAVAGTWMMLGLVGNMLARALGDDDDNKPGIDKLDMVPNYRRATQFIFAPDTYGGAIPVAYGWNVFMAAGHYMYDSMFGYLKPEEAAGRVMTAAFDAFAPIGSGAESKTFAGMALKTGLPSPMVPIVEMAMNENRFGAPIYKEQSPFSNVKEADAYMHFNSVNPISKWAMQSLAEATSGSKNPRYNSALIDVNPGSVDHFISNYLPGLFSEAYKAAGVAITAGQGRDTKEQDLPVISRLRAKVDEESFDAGAFRRVSEAVDTKYKEYMAPDTSKERRAEILKEHPNIGAVKAMLSGSTQQIKSMRQNLEAVERDPNVSEERKVGYRNRVEKMEEEYRRRAVKEALKRGFRDAVIDNSPD